MYIKVDKRTAGKFVLTSQTDEHGDMRRYYIARRETGKLMIIVCRNGWCYPTWADRSWTRSRAGKTWPCLALSMMRT